MNECIIKRLIDILFSLVGLVILISLLPVIGLLIKLDSKGPIFCPVDRVGKNMKIFKMYKFRTMLETPIQVGESLSPQFDPRVTQFGRFLRRTKMNELPQFVNILRGEMTFVGPRPEAPDLAALYPAYATKVFSVKPGLVGPSTILGRNEEESFPPEADAKKYYIEKILPGKVRLDLEYVEKQKFSVLEDVMYIIAGVKETLIGTVTKQQVSNNRSQFYLLIADVWLMMFSFMAAVGFSAERTSFRVLVVALPAIIAVRLPCNIYFGMYNSLIRYVSCYDVLAALKGVTCGSLVLVAMTRIFELNSYPIKALAVDWVCLSLLLPGLRFALTLYWKKGETVSKSKSRILIYGATDSGYRACRRLAFDNHGSFEIIGFIDDAADKYGKRLNGIKVLGNRFHIKALALLHKVEEIVIAEENIDPDNLAEVIKICLKSNLRIRMYTAAANDVVSIGGQVSAIRNLELSDILPLQRIHSDHIAVSQVLAGKTILIHGAAGSLGVELCRSMLQLGCRKLIIAERYESYLNEIVAALAKWFSVGSIVPLLHDTSRTDSLDEAFENYRPDIVIHAGMRKYVPFLAVDLEDIILANYLFTSYLAKRAAEFQCEFFVAISSMMAADGRNFVTESLRVAELSLKYFFNDTGTRLIIARLCDVAENRGGVVSLIEKQIAHQRAVTLPSRDAMTCLVSKQSAAEFILQSLAEAKKGVSGKELFVCHGGSPIELIEITRRLAKFYGLELGPDIEVKYDTQPSEDASTFSPAILEQAMNSGDDAGIRADTAGNIERIRSFFRNLALTDNDEVTHQDWKAKTKEFIRLSRLDLLAREA